jgi:glycosyltransferase involved in cell wall biosynthesis
MLSRPRIPSVDRLLEVARTLRSVVTLARRLDEHMLEVSERLDAISSKVEGTDAVADAFEAAKLDPAYFAAYDRPEPLVTVCIATYNRAELVTTRAIPSLLAQDYKNLQVLVVGDGCTDDTPARVASIRDARVSFVNLAERGRYPQDPLRRWMVAGSAAMNEGLRLAEGDFVGHLDDDDEHLPQRISTLVTRLKASRSDLVWHPFWTERPHGWELVEGAEFRRKGVTTGSTLYHRWLTRIPWDLAAHRLAEGGDWNRLRKFRYIGAKVEREPTPLLRHFRERAQAKS